MDEMYIYPAKHYRHAAEERSRRPSSRIGEELEERLRALQAQGKLLEAQRLEQRTRYDMEMLREVGYCPGIENYTPAPRRPRAGRAAVHADRLSSRRTSC